MLEGTALGPNHRKWQRYTRENDIWFPPAVAAHILRGDTHLHSLSTTRARQRRSEKETHRWALEAARIGDTAVAQVDTTSWNGSDEPERKELLESLHRHLESVFFGSMNRLAAPALKFAELGDRVAGRYEATTGWWRWRQPLRQVTLSSGLLAFDSPFWAVSTLMHERVHDHQYMHSHGLAPAGHHDATKLARMRRNFRHPALWLLRYRLAPVEQDAWATDALALLRYALRLDGPPEHRENVSPLTGLYLGAWRRLPYYTADNPPPPLEIELRE